MLLYRYDEYKHDMNHMLKPSKSQGFNQTEQLWKVLVLDSALNHQNIKWGNIFWKNCVHPSSRVHRCGEAAQKLFWRLLVAKHQTTTLFLLICHKSLFLRNEIRNISSSLICKIKRVKTHISVQRILLLFWYESSWRARKENYSDFFLLVKQQQCKNSVLQVNFKISLK